MEMIRLFNSKRNNFRPINHIYLESTPGEFSNGMSHYAESVFCQKLQNRRFIPKGYLDALIFGSTNTKELEKSVFF